MQQEAYYESVELRSVPYRERLVTVHTQYRMGSGQKNRHDSRRSMDGLERLQGETHYHSKEAQVRSQEYGDQVDQRERGDTTAGFGGR